ncbi:efflux RND transporter periplasmic adaptor subunit [Phenylobacterium montanum]|uniref:Efflux RND transporter periplasmic adaptor subunit n=1 Tax=Phenylobacterium montanum TaxID=2823693 RepID=A0A975G2G9_9CAUL|nr:efflux RND transporter periplasmic adaptor subunit [Caulobacter sp. S6]QUD88796.1 efflux RND transporter periplasmic adaptor subunit [Caulobacter sp. S6]
MRRTPLLALLALAACSKGEADKEPTPTALVTTAVVAKASVADTVTAYGAAEFSPNGEHSLTAPVEAVVDKVLAPPGTRVTAGQAVVELKASPTSQLDLNKARADADAAAKAYARAQRLRAEGLDSDADVETAKATAEAAVQNAKSLAARGGAGLVLRAPAAGVVEQLALSVGDQAAQGATVAKIGTLSSLRVRLGVEPSAAANLRAGAETQLTPLAGGEERTAKVVSVDPRLDAQTKLASALVEAPAGAFAPGQPLKGVIALRQQAGVVVIPRAAVLYDQEQPYVFVEQKSAAHRRDIKLGAESGDGVAVLNGLSAGERIVVEGASALDDGMAVREGKAAKPAADDDK